MTPGLGARMRRTSGLNAEATLGTSGFGGGGASTSRSAMAGALHLEPAFARRGERAHRGGVHGQGRQVRDGRLDELDAPGPPLLERDRGTHPRALDGLVAVVVRHLR